MMPQSFQDHAWVDAIIMFEITYYLKVVELLLKYIILRTEEAKRIAEN